MSVSRYDVFVPSRMQLCAALAGAYPVSLPAALPQPTTFLVYHSRYNQIIIHGSLLSYSPRHKPVLCADVRSACLAINAVWPPVAGQSARHNPMRDQTHPSGIDATLLFHQSMQVRPVREGPDRRSLYSDIPLFYQPLQVSGGPD